jgi:hypothetical protein
MFRINYERVDFSLYNDLELLILSTKRDLFSECRLNPPLGGLVVRKLLQFI